jgi:hypothetical protein
MTGRQLLTSRTQRCQLCHLRFPQGVCDNQPLLGVRGFLLGAEGKDSSHFLVYLPCKVIVRSPAPLVEQAFK